MSIMPDLPFLNIHNPFTNESISDYTWTNIVACLRTQRITLLHKLTTCLTVIIASAQCQFHFSTVALKQIPYLVFLQQLFAVSQIHVYFMSKVKKEHLQSQILIWSIGRQFGLMHQRFEMSARIIYLFAANMVSLSAFEPNILLKNKKVQFLHTILYNHKPPQDFC